MKNLLLSLVAILAISFASAQTVTPRWGNSSKDDNTFRALSLSTQTVAIATTSIATVKPAGTYYNLITISSSSLTTPTVNIVTTKAYFGDRLDVVILPFAGTRTLTLGTGIIGNGTVTYTLTNAKQNIIWFLFDGAKYQQYGLSQQP